MEQISTPPNVLIEKKKEERQNGDLRRKKKEKKFESLVPKKFEAQATQNKTKLTHRI